MDKVAAVVQLIKTTSSTTSKQYILKKNENLPGFKEILKFIYDPYSKTGISKSKLKKIEAIRANKDWPICGGTYTYKDAIEYFTIHKTGDDAGLHFSARFIEDTVRAYPGNEAALMLAKAIITQDLKIGVTSTTLNTVYGAAFIPKIGCMLGTLLSEVDSSAIMWPAIVTKKHDGVRRLAIKEMGVVKMYSRSGHEDPWLVEIVKEMKFLPDNTVYDGELLAIGVFEDCIAQRQATNSIANRKAPKTGVTFNIFDMVPLNEYKKSCSIDIVEVRKALLAATLMDESLQLLNSDYAKLIAAFGVYHKFDFIKATPILGVVNSMDEVTPIVEALWAQGQEGVMLNTRGSLYKLKRTKTLLKVKRTEEMLLEIIGYNEGNGDFEGMLGSFIVDYKGTAVGVGSGLDVPMRKKVWSNQEHYMGKMIEVETFGESHNAAGIVSINCPIYKRVKGEA